MRSAKDANFSARRSRATSSPISRGVSFALAGAVPKSRPPRTEVVITTLVSAAKGGARDFLTDAQIRRGERRGGFKDRRWFWRPVDWPLVASEESPALMPRVYCGGGLSATFSFPGGAGKVDSHPPP